MSLDALVGALLPTGAGIGVTLDEDHAVQAVVSARLLLAAGFWHLAAAWMRLIVPVQRLAVHKHVWKLQHVYETVEFQTKMGIVL